MMKNVVCTKVKESSECCRMEDLKYMEMRVTMGDGNANIPLNTIHAMDGFT